MNIEKGKTAKYLREKRPVQKEVTENLKYFTRTRKTILEALKDSAKTVPQLADQLDLPAHEVMYYLMSLMKYGLVEPGDMDDMDEYFYYKLKSDGKDKS